MNAKNKKESFTVLMSTYRNDDKNHLKEALQSIYDNQTLKPNEIVIVIDGKISSDLNEVIEDFARNTPNVKVLPLKNNVGLGNALNLGLKLCTYDYIARMDADDVSLPHRFQVQMDFAIDNPNVDAFGSYISEFGFRENKTRTREVPEKHDDIFNMLKTRNPMNHVTAFIKRASLNALGGYIEIPLLEDYFLWIRMLESGFNLANIPTTLVNVRTEEDFNKKRSNSTRIVGWWKLQKYMVKIGFISYLKLILNMIYITIFTYFPSKLKTHIYTKILRVDD